MPHHRWLQTLGLLSLTVLMVLTLHLPPKAVTAAMAESWIPTTSMTWNGGYVRLPDWSQLTFGTLPPFSQDGAFESSADLNQSLGYDLSRYWQAGQSVETVLTLGDVQTSLYPQLFNLNTIAQITQLDLNQVALDALEMLPWQTLNDLVAAIPNLGQFSIHQIPPVEALMASVVPRQDLTQRLEQPLETTALSAVLAEFPDLGQVSLGQLGDLLNQFAIPDIPGLSSISLQNLRNWSNSTLAGVPGLVKIPFDQMPSPITGVGVVGRIDMVYGPAETRRKQSISGSYQAGFQVPCQETCAHVELTGPPALHGKQWMSGQYQQVNGGEGVLASVNGGQEPTGRHPFGEVFKVVLWEVDESSGTVSTALFFRICQRSGFLTPDLGCTPYFIGPIPFMNYRETEFMLIGPLNGAESTPGALAPAAAGETIRPAPAASSTNPQASEITRTADGLEPVSTCAGLTGEIRPANLVTVIASARTGPSESIGPYVCDGQGNCGRSLGRYHLMSYRPDVRSVIAQQPGGDAFLNQLDAGGTLEDTLLERFFPTSAQTRLMEADLAQALDEAQAEGFKGTALIQRIGQVYFGGPGVPVGTQITDVHGQIVNPADAAACLTGGGPP